MHDQEEEENDSNDDKEENEEEGELSSEESNNEGENNIQQIEVFVNYALTLHLEETAVARPSRFVEGNVVQSGSHIIAASIHENMHWVPEVTPIHCKGECRRAQNRENR